MKDLRLIGCMLATLTTSILRAEDDLADIRDPLWIWTTQETLLLAAGLTLLSAAIAYFLWTSSRKRRPAEEPTFRRADIFTRTRESLAELENQIDTLASTPFAFEVSGVIRTFLEDTLDVPVTDRTTEEFLTSLQSFTGFDTEARQRLSSFLEQCDLVKYARQELARDARLTLLASARSLVDAVEALEKPVATPTPKT
ncbi:MAG: hypothetical protein JJT96_12745 [Opitutales bacterium]|nr:hypothetical protein [Opitutales bacterium]